jgi:hypothetical protein
VCRRGAIRLSVTKVVSGRQVELGRLLRRARRPRACRWCQTRRAGLGARCRCPLELGEPACLGAVGSPVNLDLLVTSKAELMGPQVGHGVGGREMYESREVVWAGSRPFQGTETSMDGNLQVAGKNSKNDAS